MRRLSRTVACWRWNGAPCSHCSTNSRRSRGHSLSGSASACARRTSSSPTAPDRGPGRSSDSSIRSVRKADRECHRALLSDHSSGQEAAAHHDVAPSSAFPCGKDTTMQTPDEQQPQLEEGQQYQDVRFSRLTAHGMHFSSIEFDNCHFSHCSFRESTFYRCSFASC